MRVDLADPAANGDSLTAAIAAQPGTGRSVGVGDTTAPGLPVRLSRTPMRLGDPPRRPGSDAPAILKEVGLEAELSKLENSWVLQVKDLPAAWAGGG